MLHFRGGSPIRALVHFSSDHPAPSVHLFIFLDMITAINRNTTFGLLGLLGIFIAHSTGNAAAAPKAAPVPLTAAGEKLEARYAAELSALRVEIAKALPAVDGQKKTALEAAGQTVRKATAQADAAKKGLGGIQEAKALVDHAKGKWIGGAEKGIAQAQEMLKKAATEEEREAARKELAKWQANKEDGLKALAERQAALDKAKPDDPRLTRSHEEAQAALTRAQADEFEAARAVLAMLDPFLAGDKLDSKLVKCAVLVEATPRGLAEFGQQSGEAEGSVVMLLENETLMKAMLEAGGAKDGKYGQAGRIYNDILKASPRAQEGILNRLALGTSLEQAVPVSQRNAVAQTDGPAVVDPVKRYLHYEKAFLAGELDPAFAGLSAWECRFVTNSDAPDHVLAWGREMLRNYRPDHILNPDYGWRYSGLVRTDVTYRHSQDYQDDDSLEFFQNVLRNGGICGRRAFFGRFIVRSFGLPAWGVTQHAHAALGRWTPAGWVVNLGANWQFSWFEGRSGPDFVLETQARKDPGAYRRVLRAQWAGQALGEPKVNSMKEGSGGWWNVMALYEEKRIVAAAKPAELSALGQDLAEANESPATKAMAVEKTVVTDADRKIVVGADGTITVPAAAFGGGNPLVKSFLGGQQMLCGGKEFTCEIMVPKAANYTLTARVVAVHDEQRLRLTPNDAKTSTDLVIPFTCGQWQKTAPVTVALVQGKNVLAFSKPATGFALKELTLTPVP